MQNFINIILYLDNEEVLPAMLIENANRLIDAGENILLLGWNVNARLVLQLEAEIEGVRIIVRELQNCEQDKILDIKKLHEIDERLLHAENRLEEEELGIYHQHQIDISGGL